MKPLLHRICVLGSALLMSFWLLLSMGCPATPGPTDGGPAPIPDVKAPLSCDSGVLCLHVSTDEARACDILFKNAKDIASPQVDFASHTLGQFKYRDSRLALSFLVQKDQPFGKTESVVLIKLGDGVKQLEISQATCYDKSGKKIANAEIDMRRP